MADLDLTPILLDLSKKIVKKNGVREPFTLTVSNALAEEVIITINAGNPANIFIAESFVFKCFFDKKMNPVKINLEKAIELVPRMTKTLRNLPVLAGESIALKQDAKKWIRSNLPSKYVRVIADKYFKVSYAVTVEEVISGTSITLNGKDPNKLEKEAKHRLSSMIVYSEDQEEIKELLEMERTKISDTQPVSVNLKIIDDRTTDKEFKYE